MQTCGPASTDEHTPPDVRLTRRKWEWKWKCPCPVVFRYLVSFLDRSAIGNARLYGLETDLGLTDTQYDIALTVCEYRVS